MVPTLPAFDAFCGFGGWTTAAHRTGRIGVRYAVNHYAPAIEAHKRAHPETVHACQDIAEFDFGVCGDEIRGGVLFASPSCKGGSTAGQPARKGTGGNGSVCVADMMRRHKGQRSLALHVLSAAESLAPDVVLVENVDGMRDWIGYGAWLGWLRDVLGYEVREHVRNAYAYGDAVDRPRLIVTASRRGPIDISPEPEGRRRSIRDCLDADADERGRWNPIDTRKPRTRDLIRSKQEQAGRSEGLLNNVGDGVRLRDLDADPFPSLTTKSGSQLMHVQGDRVRIVNPTELARAMGWRDEELHALPRNRETCSILIGNAIPVTLAESVTRQALTSFN